jgi:hypothetical protein
MHDRDYIFYVFKKIIRLGFAFLEGKIKVGHVIREDKGDDSPLIELNSNFEFANMRWIPKIVEYSKVDEFKNYNAFEDWLAFELRITNVKSISKVVESSKI